MDEFNLLIILAASTLAGAFNALAGGGTFFLFPALIEVGLTPIVANATSASALITGYASSALTFRQHITRIVRDDQRHCLIIVLISLLGSVIGAVALGYISAHAFKQLIPVLLLIATLLFAYGGRISQHLTQQAQHPVLSYALILMVSVYGGFFGAGMGIMLMFALALIYPSIHHQLAIKHLLSLSITLVSVMVFIYLDLINYRFQWIAIIGAIIGGYLGSRLSLVIPSKTLKVTIVVLGFALTIAYAYQTYAPLSLNP